jgi:hypothetical protein
LSSDLKKNIARIITPTRTLYFHSLAKAFDYSDVMIEEHKVEARDVLGNYVLMSTKWLPDCSNPQEDTFGGVSDKSNQWGVRA